MIEPTEIERLLREQLDVQHIEIEDLTGTRDHYRLVLVSSDFEGVLPIKQHRLIYAALAEPMKGPIHALTIESYAPTQWSAR